MMQVAIFALALQGSTVAVARCNDLAIVHAQDVLRSYEAAPPSAEARDARFTALAQIRKDATDESVILQSVCSQSDLVPLASSLFAIEAWALSLQADLANLEYGVSCPSAQLPVDRGFIAEAWLNVVRAKADDPTPPAVVANVEDKVRMRAKALQLQLPSASATTNFWLTGIQNQGRDAAKACKQ